MTNTIYKAREYITVTHGIAGYFAIYVRDHDVHQSGIGRYKTQAEAISEAKSWAEAEGVRYQDPDILR